MLFASSYRRLPSASLLVLIALLGCDLGDENEQPGPSGSQRQPQQSPEADNQIAKPMPAGGFDDFRVDVETTGEITVCQVTFDSMPSKPEIAAEIVRGAVEQLVEKNGDREILAMAFNTAGDALPERQYGGSLVYKPSDRKILRMDERRELQVVESDEGSYHVQIEESKTYEGITPQRKWFNVSIVFESVPPAKQLRAAVETEIDKLKPRGLDANLYIFAGDKENKITWKQAKAPNGKFMAIDYVDATGEVTPNWDWKSFPPVADKPKYESRKWTDASGAFSVDAVFVSRINDRVTIKRNDNGEKITIQLDKLSNDCQQYIRSLRGH